MIPQLPISRIEGDVSSERLCAFVCKLLSPACRYCFMWFLQARSLSDRLPNAELATAPCEVCNTVQHLDFLYALMEKQTSLCPAI